MTGQENNFTFIDRVDIGEQAGHLNARDLDRVTRVADAAGLTVVEHLVDDSAFMAMRYADLNAFALTRPRKTGNFHRDVRADDASTAWRRIANLDQDLARHSQQASLGLPGLVQARINTGETVIEVRSLAARLDASRDDPRAWVGMFPRQIAMLRDYVSVRLTAEADRATER